MPATILDQIRSRIAAVRPGLFREMGLESLVGKIGTGQMVQSLGTGTVLTNLGLKQLGQTVASTRSTIRTRATSLTAGGIGSRIMAGVPQPAPTQPAPQAQIIPPTRRARPTTTYALRVA